MCEQYGQLCIDFTAVIPEPLDVTACLPYRWDIQISARKPLGVEQAGGHSDLVLLQHSVIVSLIIRQIRVPARHRSAGVWHANAMPPFELARSWRG